MEKSFNQTVVRKIQKSKTGFYLNLPKKLAAMLELDGSEYVKINYCKQSNNIVLKIEK